MKTNNTYIDKVYEALLDNPRATNQELANESGAAPSSIRIQLKRLEERGIIKISHDEGGRYVTILSEFYHKKPNESSTLKKEYYKEMVEECIAMLRECDTVNDKLKIVRELRLIIQEL